MMSWGTDCNILAWKGSRSVVLYGVQTRLCLAMRIKTFCGSEAVWHMFGSSRQYQDPAAVTVSLCNVSALICC